MSEMVLVEIRDAVMVVTVDNPPVNALSKGVPEGLVEAVKKANSDVAVRAVVVIGAGRTFIAGADINDFQKITAGQGSMPDLYGALLEIEDSRKPVVMAIHGSALGGGLETAMAGHYRVASPDAQVGQPEVKLGLIPGAGGTQRLPRLAGLEKAARMCAFGEPISAPEALTAGIVDRIIEGDLLAGAVAFALEVADRMPPKTRDRNETLKPVDLSALREECGRTRRNLGAPLAAIDAVEAAVGTSFEEGCRRESEIFRRCLFSDESKALVHAFFAERAVGKVPGIGKDTKVYPIRTAGIVGAGTMGGGIAMAFANVGIPVRVKEAEQGALDRGMAAIRKNYEASVKRGRLTAAQAEERIARITPQLAWDGFEQVDIIVEAVFESMDVKKEVFTEIDAIAKAECVLATNTSTLDVDEIAAATWRPEKVVGLHFFSPANVMRLVEIVRGTATSNEVIATVLALAKRLKKVGVVVGNGFGFVGNRMMFPYMFEAQSLAEEGAAPERIDRVLTDFGMAMGIFAVEDLAGLDVMAHIRREFPERFRGLPKTAEKLCALGRFGQKSGRGWYKYDENRKPSPDPEVLALLRESAKERGIRQREISDGEILERCLTALVDEGTRVLEEGIAARAVEIDVIYMTGYGFPAYRGGPMFWAEHRGRE